MHSDLLGIKARDLRRVIKQRCPQSIKHVSFIINVGKGNDVFLSSPQRSGCHWTLLFVDLTTNEWNYCDTIGWRAPPDMKEKVSPIVEAIYKHTSLPSKPFIKCIEAHIPNTNGGHRCMSGCLKNIPLQTCGNVCGVIVAVMATIASVSPCIWRQVFLSHTKRVPGNVEWILSPTPNSDFLRCTLLSWIISREIDLEDIGLPSSKKDMMQSDVGCVNVASDYKNEYDDDESDDEKPDKNAVTIEEVHDSADNDKRNDDDDFYVGQRMSDLEELNRLKENYENRHFCELRKRDVRYLSAAAKRAPKRVAKAKQSLVYYSILLVCKFSGHGNKKGKRIRNSKTFRQRCPFEVYIALSSDGQEFQVMRYRKEHNHQLTKEIYQHLPRQRAGHCKDNVEEIEDAIKLKANSKLLQQKVENTTGKKITLKDISNLKQNCKREVKRNDLVDLIEYLNRQPGSFTEVIINTEK